MRGDIESKTAMMDRRHHPRFIVQEPASVVVTGDDVGLPYHLVNISAGGMAFRYLNSTPLPLTDSQMDIYMGGDLYIGRLPITVVDDRPLVSDSIPARHCGVRFGVLTPAQQIQLQSFIHSQASSVQLSC